MVSELLTIDGEWIPGPESPYGNYVPDEVRESAGAFKGRKARGFFWRGKFSSLFPGTAIKAFITCRREM